MTFASSSPAQSSSSPRGRSRADGPRWRAQGARSRATALVMGLALGVGALASANLRAKAAPSAPPTAAAPAAPAAASSGPAAQQTFTVTAKLVEIPSKFPSDDLYDYVYVMRYEGVGGEWDKKTIYVGHYKPREPRSNIKDDMKKVVSGKVRSFHQGDVHKLQLTAPLKAVWKGAVVDEFAATDRKSVRYFALVADPA